MVSQVTREFNWECEGGYSRYTALIAERKRQQEMANLNQVAAVNIVVMLRRLKMLEKATFWFGILFTLH